MHTPLECHIQYAPKKYHASTKQTLMSNLLDNFTVSIKLAECEGLCPPPLTMTKITNNDRYLNLLNMLSLVLLAMNCLSCERKVPLKRYIVLYQPML